MKILNRNQTGFTLVEIAIVLVVVSVLLGYTVALFPLQQELKQYRNAEAEVDKIINSLIGFAQVNGRLPCPDTTAAVALDGLEDSVDAIINATGAAGADGFWDSCAAYSGFIPTATLGITGDLDANRNLLDPWGAPYRYHVTNMNSDADGLPLTAAAIDLVSPNGVREEGISAVVNLPPDLVICDNRTAVAANDLVCEAGANVVFGTAVAVILSTGKDRLTVLSNIQAENIDDLNNGTNDKVYIKVPRNDSTAAKFDDVIKWISPNQLFSKMIEADQLP